MPGKRQTWAICQKKKKKKRWTTHLMMNRSVKDEEEAAANGLTKSFPVFNMASLCFYWFQKRGMICQF